MVFRGNEMMAGFSEVCNLNHIGDINPFKRCDTAAIIRMHMNNPVGFIQLSQGSQVAQPGTGCSRKRLVNLNHDL